MTSCCLGPGSPICLSWKNWGIHHGHCSHTSELWSFRHSLESFRQGQLHGVPHPWSEKLLATLSPRGVRWDMARWLDPPTWACIPLTHHVHVDMGHGATWTQLWTQYHITSEQRAPHQPYSYTCQLHLWILQWSPGGDTFR